MHSLYARRIAQRYGSSSSFLHSTFTLIVTATLSLILLLSVTPAAAQTSPTNGTTTGYQSSPLRSYTFSTPVQTATATTNYVWDDSQSGRSGLAYLNGVGQYIDLTTFPDDTNQLFPTTFGGEMTVEFWAYYVAFNVRTRLWEIAAATATGPFVDNVLLGNQASTSGVNVTVRGGTFGNTSTTFKVDEQLYINRWMHIALTFEPSLIAGATTSQSGRMTLYIDGVLVTTSLCVLPRQVFRSWATLGRSSATIDEFANVYLDAFYLYNYALDGEEVAMHTVLPRPPVFALVFGRNPASITGFVSNSTYRWNLTDGTDSAATQLLRRGLVFLSSASQQYMDLSPATNGISTASTVGTVMPSIGGTSWSGASLSGWTFDVMVKVQTLSPSAKILHLGTSTQANIIQLGIAPSGTALEFAISNSRFNGGESRRTFLTTVTAGMWYHVLVVVQTTSATQATATWNIYVNGALVFTEANLCMPDNVARSEAYIGRGASTVSGGQFFTGVISSVRVLDYALSAVQASAAYNATQAPPPAPTDTFVVPEEFSTAPVNAYTFDSAPTQSMLEGGTNFEWGAGSDLNMGVAAFNGVSNFINLQFMPDSNGKTMTRRLGGDMSFEVWVKWQTFNSYSRVFDIGGPRGLADNNFFLSNYGTTNGIFFRMYWGSASAGGARADNVLQLGKWHHIVTTIRTLNASAPNSASAAVMSVYVDAVLVATAATYTPRNTDRPAAFLGMSNWPNDILFEGFIDDFIVYNYSLSHEAVQARAVTPRYPAFELVFDSDPRLFPGIGDLGVPNTYSWLQFDPADVPTNVSQWHQGLLVTNKAAGEYVNLTTFRGNAAVGTRLPRIGGDGWGTTDRGNAGWTFEVDVKFTALSRFGRVFEFVSMSSTGVLDNWVWLGFGDTATSSALRFEVRNSRVTTTSAGASIELIPSVQLNRWYHIVVVVLPQNALQGTATFVPYVDGVASASGGVAGQWIDAVDRNLAYVGRASTLPGTPVNSESMSMVIDCLRVWDYMLSAVQLDNLFTITHAPFQAATPLLYRTDPVVYHTFDEGVTEASLTQGSQFGWAQFVQQRTGIATFNGANQYINLLTFPDTRGQLFPLVIGGGSYSIELWVMFNSFNRYSRLFDLGNGAANDSLFICNKDTTSTLSARFFYDTTRYYFEVSNVFQLNTWTHVVVTAEQRNWTDISSATAAEYQVFVNGRKINQQIFGALPRRIARAQSWIGRSPYTDDQYFNGSMDAFYYYDYPLDAEQVRAHYVVYAPPTFELTFANDPRLIPGVAGTNPVYTWAPVDATDSAVLQADRTGVAVFDGARSQYIDLNARAGSTSVGTVIPSMGNTGLRIGMNRTSAGLTIEVMVKLNSASAWARVLDCGDGPMRDSIGIGFADSTNQLIFEVNNLALGTGNGNSAATTRVTLVPSSLFGLGRWYHIVVVMRRVAGSPTAGTIDAYVNGALVQSTTGVFPQQALRKQCYLGRSTYAGAAYTSMVVDVLRVYDFGFGAARVEALYNATSPNWPAYPVYPPSGTGAASSMATPVTIASSAANPLAQSSSVPIRSSSVPTVVVPTLSSSSTGQETIAASNSNSLTDGAIAGIVIGVLVGVALLFLLLVLALRSRAKFATSKYAPATHEGAGGRPAARTDGWSEHVDVDETEDATHETSVAVSEVEMQSVDGASAHEEEV